MRKGLLIALLAAGASRRLGQPKQLVRVEREPLLRRQCRIALDAQLGPVIAILGFHALPFAATIVDLDVSILVNEQWHEGIASSIRAATRAAIERDAAALLLFLADQHRLTSSDLQRLHLAWTASNGLKACRAHDQDYAGPPVIIPASCFADLLQLEGDEGARRVLATLGPAALIDVAMPNAIHDLDRSEQLSEMKPMSSTG